jgi:DNA invertase Pin-like site-specific DNA recombinase
MFEQPEATTASTELIHELCAAARSEAQATGRRLNAVADLLQVRERQYGDRPEWAADLWDAIASELAAAFSGKPRREYARMVADLEAGARDAVIVYNLDRLHRRPVELEEFVTLCERVGVSQVGTVTADIDLGNDDGLFMARIFAAFAAKESGHKSARIRRKMLQNAEAGLPHGSVRPFGYEADKMTIRESEAAVVRQMVNRYLAGQSIKSLTMWLNESGIAPAAAKSWGTSRCAKSWVGPYRGVARASRRGDRPGAVAGDHYSRRAGSGVGTDGFSVADQDPGGAHLSAIGHVAVRALRESAGFLSAPCQSG